MMQHFTKLGLHLDEHHAECPRNREDRLPTAFVWRDPADNRLLCRHSRRSLRVPPADASAPSNRRN